VYLHRFILDAPLGVEVDHRDGNGLDCRRSNLRIATRSQNAMNVEAKPQRFKGVIKNTRGHLWYAQLWQQGKYYVSRGHKTEIDAAYAYDVLAREHHGEFAWLNFPNENERGWHIDHQEDEAA
jgi:hypothetical protein